MEVYNYIKEIDRIVDRSYYYYVRQYNVLLQCHQKTKTIIKTKLKKT
jgi:hypothetical protein